MDTTILISEELIRELLAAASRKGCEVQRFIEAKLWENLPGSYVELQVGVDCPASVQIPVGSSALQIHGMFGPGRRPKAGQPLVVKRVVRSRTELNAESAVMIALAFDPQVLMPLRLFEAAEKKGAK